jgi:hypothetical protein
MGNRAGQVWLLALLCAFVAGAVVSCSSGYTLRTPADIGVLPASRGVNGGSFVALTDWEYRGSDPVFHYFWHYYNRDNLLRRSAVRIPRAGAVLDFAEHPLEEAGKWVTLGGKDREKFHFVAYQVPPSLLRAGGRTKGSSQ